MAPLQQRGSSGWGRGICLIGRRPKRLSWPPQTWSIFWPFRKPIWRPSLWKEHMQLPGRRACICIMGAQLCPCPIPSMAAHVVSVSCVSRGYQSCQPFRAAQPGAVWLPCAGCTGSNWPPGRACPMASCCFPYMPPFGSRRRLGPALIWPFWSWCMHSTCKCPLCLWAILMAQPVPLGITNPDQEPSALCAPFWHSCWALAPPG